MVETEGLLNTRTGEFDFIGRSIPIFPQKKLRCKTRRESLCQDKSSIW